MRRTEICILAICCTGLIAKIAPADQTAVEPGPPIAKLTLDQALRRAVDHNPTMKNIHEQIVQADVQINRAWSMLLPNLDANGSITLNQQEVAVGFPDFGSLFTRQPPPAETDPITYGDFGNMGTLEAVIQEKWGKTFGFSANITLFNPRSIPLIKLAYDFYDKTKIEAQVQKNDLLFGVTSAFYQVSSLKEAIGVREENLAIAERFLKLATARKNVGQATKIDVLRAEIQVTEAQKNLENAKDTYLMAKTALAYLIGMADNQFEIVAPAEVKGLSQDLGTLREQALKNRVEVKAAKLAKSISERNRQDTKMRWLPVFDLTYNWNWNSAGGFAGQNAAWMFILGARWSLFKGGDRIAELKERASVTRMAENSIHQLMLDIRQEIDQEHQEVIQRTRNVELADKQIALAEENHNLISRQYEVGLVSSLDVLNASTELSAKRIGRVLEQLQYDIALLKLRKAAGEYNSLALVANSDR